jgi:Domain of unknown function (DUF4287)
MSFQAYLDTIEDRTGLTPRRLLALAHDRGLDAPGTKAGTVVQWLAEDYGLGRGHAMAFFHVPRAAAAAGRRRYLTVPRTRVTCRWSTTRVGCTPSTRYRSA